MTQHTASLLPAPSDTAWGRLKHLVTEHPMTVFRVVFGVYFSVLFARLLPWGAKLYSDQGVLADPAMNPTFDFIVNPLYAWDSPLAVTLYLGGMLALSLAFTAGFRLRTVAVLMWLGWALLWHRNVFTLNPSLPFNGFLMLAVAFWPANLPHTLDRWIALRRDPTRAPSLPTGGPIPRDLMRVVWVVTSLAYSFSGWTKLTSPSWASGDAIQFILDGPLARPAPWVDALLNFPGLLAVLTWGTIAAELLYAPMALSRRLRPWAWLGMVALHIGLVGVLQFAELSTGMLMVHVFTFNPEWLKRFQRTVPPTMPKPR